MARIFLLAFLPACLVIAASRRHRWQRPRPPSGLRAGSEANRLLQALLDRPLKSLRHGRNAPWTKQPPSREYPRHLGRFGRRFGVSTPGHEPLRAGLLAGARALAARSGNSKKLVPHSPGCCQQPSNKKDSCHRTSPFWLQFLGVDCRCVPGLGLGVPHPRAPLSSSHVQREGPREGHRPAFGPSGLHAMHRQPCGRWSIFCSSRRARRP